MEQQFLCDLTQASVSPVAARSESAIKVVYWEVDAAVYHEEEVGYFEQSRNNLKIDKASIYICTHIYIQGVPKKRGK